MPGLLAASLANSNDFTIYKLNTLSNDIFITNADYISLCTEMFTTIGYTYALAETGNPYFVFFMYTLPEIGSNIILLFITNPNLVQLAEISIKCLSF
jgi:hypothetical protein